MNIARQLGGDSFSLTRRAERRLEYRPPTPPPPPGHESAKPGAENPKPRDPLLAIAGLADSGALTADLDEDLYEI